MRSLRALFASPVREPAFTAGERRASTLAARAVTTFADAPRDGLTLMVAETARLAAEGKYGAALCMIESVAPDPENKASVLRSRGAVLFGWGRVREAHRAFIESLTLAEPSQSDMLQLGWSHLNMGAAQECETWMRKAIEAGPNACEAHFGLATALIEQHRFDEASVECGAALELQSDDRDCLLALGGCRIQQANFGAAEQTFRRAIQLAPHSGAAWVNLGVALRMQGHHGAALEAYVQGEKLESASASGGAAFMNLALEHHIAGDLKETIEVCERRLPSSPDIVAHQTYAHALLSAGRLQEGWHHYEFRWLTDPLMSIRVGPVRPAWSGQDLTGKVVLLRMEQGFGDTIQFLRYAPLLRALGARVIMRRFSALADAFSGIDRLFGDDESPDFDYYVPLLSLPRLFDTDIATIPANIPYVHVAAALDARWSARLDGIGGLRVGIVWAGNPAHPRDRARSIPLASFAPLFDVEGARFISLQKGAPSNEADALGNRVALVNLGLELRDFDDTAAVINSLDLVISVDTSVAHLAGALGKPVWALVQRDADWRWMEKRDDSPWYPTMRLFRQRRDDDAGSWTHVVELVKAALLIAVRDGVQKGVDPSTRDIGVEARSPSPSPVRPDAATRGSVKPRGHRVGMSAVTEARVGILQYQPDEDLIGDALGWYGEWLQGELEFLGRVTRAGSTVMEVGAGIGAHAIAISRMLGAEGHLFLYENRPVVRRILQQNLNANRVGNATLMVRSLGKPEASAGDAVPKTESIDDLRLEKLQWLKIGGGVEVKEVIEGSADSLWRLRPGVFIAAADDDAMQEYAERMKAFSYRCWKMETPLYDPHNFNRREADIFAGKTALAVVGVPEEMDAGSQIHALSEILG